MIVASYDWGLIWQNKHLFLNGLATALEVAAVAIVISVVIGIALALARMGKPPLSWLAAVYINVFRGVPALVSVIWVYFGWSLVLGINFTVFQAGVIALVLLYSAFISEIYRAALEAIPRGQREAGLAVGMSPVRVFLQIVLPQATFQPFPLYTAAAGIYVIIAFVVDFLFRGIERILATPPSGPVARAATARKRRRVEAAVQRVEAVSGAR